jgi:hypothetical protein
MLELQFYVRDYNVRDYDKRLVGVAESYDYDYNVCDYYYV